jgi:hypothetical protein
MARLRAGHDERPRLWNATSYCLSVELRKQLLGVSDEIARALHQRCLARVAAAAHSIDKR